MRVTESLVLWHVGAHGPITATALAARLKVEPAGLRAVLEALGRRGYVRPDRYGVPDLTATGRDALVKLIKRAHSNAGPVRPGSSPATRVRWLATGCRASANSVRA
jgi:predicted ArsR family transcriptional regulator